VAIASNGELLVTDQEAFGGSGGVIRVDPNTGTQTPLSTGGNFVDPLGIAIEGAGPGGSTPRSGASCQGKKATLSGTDGKDRLAGTPVSDVLLAGDGNDKVRGLDGDDRLCGGGGNDSVSGGGGDDRLRGDAGNDTLKGGPGTDLCVGGPGKDRATGCEKTRSVP
jgi:Ca2+-binding RTX toxin-like protein